MSIKEVNIKVQKILLLNKRQLKEIAKFDCYLTLFDLFFLLFNLI